MEALLYRCIELSLQQYIEGISNSANGSMVLHKKRVIVNSTIYPDCAIHVCPCIAEAQHASMHLDQVRCSKLLLLQLRPACSLPASGTGPITMKAASPRLETRHTRLGHWLP